ncbi:MAG: ABC transporter permease [Natronomonas sp.]
MRPKKLLRIARWEVTSGVGQFDRGALAVGIAALVFVVAVGLVGATGGVAVEDGLYRVGVTPDSQLAAPLDSDTAFAVEVVESDELEDIGLTSGHYDVVVLGNTVYPSVRDGKPTEKSFAAISAMRSSVKGYNDRQLSAEPNASAAFPVVVTIEYVSRESVDGVPSLEDIETTSDDETSDGDSLGDDSDSESSKTDAPELDDGGSDDSATGDGTDPAGTDSETTTDEEVTPSNTDGGPDIGGLDVFDTGGTTGSPSDIQPPFPFQSLILAFVFVIPLNFLVQAYGSSMLSERLGRRGELLLVSPISPTDIVLGKTLPYGIAATAITVAIVGGIRILGGDAGVLSVIGVLPLALLFLSMTFLGAMFARSFKELTFVSVTISVVLTTYAFVPAIFTETSSVAFVSPLALVVRDLAGTGATFGQVAFATGPPSLTAVVCFVLGLGLYREEDLFTQRPVHLKAIDSLAGRIRRPRSLVLVVGMLVPFVFVAELLAVALLFALPLAVSLPAIFALVAIVEELAKGLPVYAGFLHARYKRTFPIAVATGLAAGSGFFLAEKLTLAVQFVGLSDLVIADAAFQTGFGTGSLPVIVALALAPFVLHVVTATVSSIGASRDRTSFLVGLGAAIAIHVGYNLAVVSYLV